MDTQTHLSMHLWVWFCVNLKKLSDRVNEGYFTPENEWRIISTALNITPLDNQTKILAIGNSLNTSLLSLPKNADGNQLLYSESLRIMTMVFNPTNMSELTTVSLQSDVEKPVNMAVLKQSCTQSESEIKIHANRLSDEDTIIHTIEDFLHAYFNIVNTSWREWEVWPRSWAP